MSEPMDPLCAVNPALRAGLHCSLGLLVGLYAAAAYPVDDAYLQLLDEEVSKVGGIPTDAADSRETAVRDAAMAGMSSAARSRGDFETLLQKRHVGTYSFYRRLPERSREEIYIDYREGASLDVLRAKIVDRFLHP